MGKGSSNACTAVGASTGPGSPIFHNGLYASARPCLGKMHYCSRNKLEKVVHTKNLSASLLTRYTQKWKKNIDICSLTRFIPLSVFCHLVIAQSLSHVWLWCHGLYHARLCPLHYIPEFAQIHVHWVPERGKGTGRADSIWKMKERNSTLHSQWNLDYMPACTFSELWPCLVDMGIIYLAAKLASRTDKHKTYAKISHHQKECNNLM